MEADAEKLTKSLSEDKDKADRLKALTRTIISTVLAEEDHAMQALALCDSTALWIAAHVGPKEEIEPFRAGLLDMFVKCVKALIPVNEKMIHERMKTETDEGMKALYERVIGNSPRH